MDKLNIITVQTGKIVCGHYSALESNGCFRNQEVPVIAAVLYSMYFAVFLAQSFRRPSKSSNRSFLHSDRRLTELM